MAKFVSVASHLFSNNIRDAHEKLRGCIVSYQGKWWWLQEYLDDWTVLLTSTDIDQDTGNSREVTSVDLSRTSPNAFLVGPFSLGMANFKGAGVYFVARRPLRRNKFGLREENCDIVHVAGESHSERVTRSFSALYSSNALDTMLKGIYPSFKNCLTAIQTNQTWAVAFNRAFALERVGLKLIVLKYRTTSIGEVDLNTGAIDLYPSHGHMVDRCKAIQGCPSVSVYQV